MKKIIFLSLSILIGILVYQKNEEIIIPNDAIRMRIIANSNDINDLYAKKKLKKDLEEDLYNFISTSTNSKEANMSIENNLNSITNLVASKTDDFTISYGNNYFPKKTYRGVIYPEGEYKSLVITLGKGLGENWWCVLYPPLCLIEDNSTTSDVLYRSYIYDALTN